MDYHKKCDFQIDMYQYVDEYNHKIPLARNIKMTREEFNKTCK